MRVAMVGLGTMGLPMARHLVAAGHDVVGCDLDPSRVEALGARAASTAAEAAAGADVGPALAALAGRRGGRGARGGRRPCGRDERRRSSPTCRPARPRLRAASRPSARRSTSSTRPSAADRVARRRRHLTVMVGGVRRTRSRAAGRSSTCSAPSSCRVGGHGAGQAAKLCNNLDRRRDDGGVAEACAIAVAGGDRPEDRSTELLTASTGDSRVLRTRFPLPGVDAAHPASNGFAPLFALDLMAKDLGLALELARRARRSSAPVARAALDAYRAAQQRRAGRARLLGRLPARRPTAAKPQTERSIHPQREGGVRDGRPRELVPEAIHEQDGLKVSKSPWGADDEIGRLNWVTPESTAAILDHLDGRHVFDLNVEYFIGMPSWVAAGDPRYGIWMTHTPQGSVNDNLSGVGCDVHETYSYCGDSIHMYTHCGTHIDTLNHLGFYGKFWNGWEADGDLGSRIWNKGGLEKYPPVISRGVLLDVAGHARRRRAPRRLRDHAGGPAGHRHEAGRRAAQGRRRARPHGADERLARLRRLPEEHARDRPRRGEVALRGDRRDVHRRRHDRARGAARPRRRTSSSPCTATCSRPPARRSSRSST